MLTYIHTCQIHVHSRSPASGGCSVQQEVQEWRLHPDRIPCQPTLARLLRKYVLQRLRILFPLNSIAI